MLALSVRQPWASLIVRGLKDIENRDWATRVRGRILIHASQGMGLGEWQAAIQFAHRACGVAVEALAGLDFDEVRRGGLVGAVTINDCVDSSPSKWFVGKHGLVLSHAAEFPRLIPWKGQLKFFDVPAGEVVTALGGDSTWQQ